MGIGSVGVRGRLLGVRVGVVRVASGGDGAAVGGSSGDSGSGCMADTAASTPDGGMVVVLDGNDE